LPVYRFRRYRYRASAFADPLFDRRDWRIEFHAHQGPCVELDPELVGLAMGSREHGDALDIVAERHLGLHAQRAF